MKKICIFSLLCLFLSSCVQTNVKEVNMSDYGIFDFSALEL